MVTIDSYEDVPPNDEVSLLKVWQPLLSNKRAQAHASSALGTCRRLYQANLCLTVLMCEIEVQPASCNMSILPPGTKGGKP